MGCAADGTTLRMETQGASVSSAITIKLNTWFHACLVKNGSSFVLYYNGLPVVITTDASANNLITQLGVGNDGPGSFTDALDGRLEGIKIFSAALSAAEVRAEMRQHKNVRNSSVYNVTPFYTYPDVRDQGGSNHPFAFGGDTWSTASGPGKPWVALSPLPRRFLTAPAGGAVTGALAASLPHLTASLVGVMAPAGTVVATLPHLTASLVGLHKQTGTVVASLPHLTASIAAVHKQTGTIAATLPHLTAAFVGVQTQTGTIAASLPHLTSAFLGTQTQTGIVVATLPHLTAALVGVQTQTGTIVATLPHLTAAMTGTHTAGGAATGTIVATLPHLTGVFVGVMAPKGTVAATLPRLTAILQGVVTGSVRIATPGPRMGSGWMGQPRGGAGRFQPPPPGSGRFQR